MDNDSSMQVLGQATRTPHVHGVGLDLQKVRCRPKPKATRRLVLDILCSAHAHAQAQTPNLIPITTNRRQLSVSKLARYLAVFFDRLETNRSSASWLSFWIHWLIGILGYARSSSLVIWITPLDPLGSARFTLHHFLIGASPSRPSAILALVQPCASASQPNPRTSLNCRPLTPMCQCTHARGFQLQSPAKAPTDSIISVLRRLGASTPWGTQPRPKPSARGPLQLARLAPQLVLTQPTRLNRVTWLARST